jgi:hypothetical protein
MSKLDRIFYRLAQFKLKSMQTDWILIKSDHAAVVAHFEHNSKRQYKNSHIKLDNEILKNPEQLMELRT